LLAGSAMAEPLFNRIASFPVALTLPEGADAKTPTSAEIISATPDGMTLIFSDSPNKRIGFIDITDPKAPKPAGSLALDGEPTSQDGARGAQHIQEQGRAFGYIACR